MENLLSNLHSFWSTQVWLFEDQQRAKPDFWFFLWTQKWPECHSNWTVCCFNLPFRWHCNGNGYKLFFSYVSKGKVNDAYWLFDKWKTRTTVNVEPILQKMNYWDRRDIQLKELAGTAVSWLLRSSSDRAVWSHVSRRSGKRFAPEYTFSNSKISKRIITEQFYSHIINMSRGSLHTGSFRRIHLSVFTAEELKMAFRA